MGGGPHHDTCWRPTSAGARHVRARLSYGLWCSGRTLCRHLYGSNPLGQRREAVRTIQPRRLVDIPCATARATLLVSPPNQKDRMMRWTFRIIVSIFVVSLA